MALHSRPRTLQNLLELPESMDISQIEFKYRAEGNANLVLALPQFKKVLRLPKVEKIQPGLQLQEEQKELPQHDQEKQKQQLEEFSQEEQLQKDQSVTQLHVDSWLLAKNILNRDTISEPEKETAPTELTMEHFKSYIDIIRNYVGKEYVFDADVVVIPNEKDRDFINNKIAPFRPEHRLDKEFGGQFGLLLTDATQLPAEFSILFSNYQQPKTTTSPTKTTTAMKAMTKLTGDTYAIEIKPKQGWLLPTNVDDLFDLQPPTLSILAAKRKFRMSGGDTQTSSPDQATGSSQTSTASSEARNSLSEPADYRCRFCTMQYLKLHQRKINTRTGYCPLDLFSGERERMEKAIKALIQCPQNNFRIYINGDLIYGDHQSSLSLQELQDTVFKRIPSKLLIDIIIGCILRDYTKYDFDESEVSEMDFEVSKDTQENQVNFDEISYPSFHCGPSLLLPEGCILHKVSLLQMFAMRHFRSMANMGYLEKTTKTYECFMKLLQHHKQWNFKSLSPVEEYIMGATGFDCSIMIAFQEIETKRRSRRRMKTKVCLLDLDPKPDSHFSKYVQQTKESRAEWLTAQFN